MERVLPESLSVRFQPAPNIKEKEAGPKGEVTCPLKGEKWNCELPAGVLDLQLRAKGHISHYRWGLKIPPGTVLDVGRLELRRGASLIGWVQTEEKLPASSKSCRVTLVPRLAGPQFSEGDKERSRALQLSVAVNERGFFHIDGIPPGGYRVVAWQEGYSRARRDVDIIESAQAELKEPLILDRPRTLQVLVSPPQDPWGKAWRVRLSETGDEPSRSFEVANSVVSEDGAWTRKGLPGGQYRLRVESHLGDGW